MNEYSIHISNGKVVGDSTFYLLSYESLKKECDRLEHFTESLEKNPQQKKEQIAEYKCAKYRYASVSLIHSTIYNNNKCRTRSNIEYSHYILKPFDELFKECAEYLALYEAAPADEKPDYSLYYAMLIFIQKELSNLEEKHQNSSDWEKVELEERIGGLQFAKECLDEAWERRKDVIV